MNLNLIEVLRGQPVVALVGATNDSSKFGNIIMRDLRGRDFTVIPINPRAQAVEGIPAFPNLKDAHAEHEIGLVVYVVPPKFTLQSLEEARTLGLNRVWVQPGAGDDAVQSYLEEHGFEYLMNACVMIEAR